MSGAAERTQYSTSILVAQKPIDATEIVRVRLSQAKLLNDEFANFFRKYYSIKSQYLNDLNKLVKESEDLNKNIEKRIIENQVLSREEMQHYNIDAIGELSGIWDKIILEIKDEIAANNQLRQVVDHEVVHPLVDYTTKSKSWSDVRSLHSKLSQIAEAVEFNQEKLDKYNENPSKYQDKIQKYQQSLTVTNNDWAAEAPYVFEVFENTDFARLNFLRDSLLRFITAYTDSLNKVSESNERTLETILNFNPETEISRFAKVSSETTYIPKETRKAAESPQVTNHSSFPSVQGLHMPSSPLTKRHASVATTGTNNTTLTSSKEEKAPKQRTKLRSKVGSIFGKKKKDKKKFEVDDALAESEASSLRDVPTPGPAHRLSTVSSMASASVLKTPKNPAKDDDSLYQPRQSKAQPQPVAKNSPVKPQSAELNSAPLSFNQAPLQPTIKSNGFDSSSSFNNTQQRNVSDNSYTDQSSHINVATDKPQASFPPVSQQHSFSAAPQQEQSYPVASQLKPAALTSSSNSPFQTAGIQEQQQSSQQPPQHQQHYAPPPPPARKSQHFGNQSLTNIREDGDFSFAKGHQPLPSHSENAPQPPASRRDIQSGLFTNLSQSDLENHSNKRISSFNSFGSAPQLRPQSTGSSIMGNGTGLFNHPTLTLPGLNASIAEVISAKFKDGQQVSSQIVGEIAFNYQHDQTLEASKKANLKIDGIDNIDRIIPNNQFLKKIDEDEFEISLDLISARTLGGLKYQIKESTAPVIVLPAWRFEQHQASVMLTVKLIPELASALKEGEYIQLDNLIVSVSIQGASTSALSKPQGTFNKEKSRIAWRFNEPIKLNATSEQKLVARFMTETEAKENEQGVLVKFSINDEGNSKYVTSNIQLRSQTIAEDDPFAEESWTTVPTFKTLVAGNYSGL